MATPRVIATDLDGTLLRSDSTLSDRTRKALRITRAAGVRVVAATARPARVIEDLFGSEDLIDLALCGNGAVRYEVGSHQILITHPLREEVTRQVMAEVSRLVPGAGFAVETGHHALFEPGYRYRPTLDSDRVPVATLAELVADPLVKIMVWLPDQDPDAAWERLRPGLDQLVECTWSTERAPLEIAAPGVSKAAALATLCQDWTVDPAEVIAFGDGPNDLPMLAWAGTPYAVANAHAAVLAATPNHTAGNDEDGVARVLEELFA
ncbi:Cof-type HAD-IIB family hydrolase [Micromonospora soli]|uniref:Cof-type HAD-IIB family hydrolase n=1 Tax=Micromonospora sp. NBRC 110009 TaxID=3061627 RepID=UPI002674154C|nr:Cof-type HAD-IIB family hydrolase [Micromonospora sp. NBRC 110009]WKU00318.1 Cof-type HAD-IIB family hydrolase [Micromonospora sp. NBRC 110009]